MSNQSESEKIDRRTYLTALSAASATGLAGCGGGGSGSGNGSGSGSGSGSGDQKLGERVPTVPFATMTGVAGASGIEQVNGQIAKMVQKHLGVQTEVKALELGTYWQRAYNDSREFNFSVDLSPPFMQFLDPANLIRPYHIKNAGANGRPNTSNYANCEFSRAVEKQAQAESVEARHKSVNNALEASSNDIAPITLVTNINSGAYRTDQVNPQKMGKSGVNARNGDFLWHSEPKGSADAINVNMTPNNINSPVFFKSDPPAPWNATVYSPLLYYNRNFEVKPHLAKDFEISNGRKTFTFHLREDATFHNGNPITAEDVKWTYEFMNSHPSKFAPVPQQSYESIKAKDEHTVEINLTKPNAAFLNAFVPIWGIVPKDVWIEAGAEENPANPDFSKTGIVGSGPYQVTDFTPKQLLALEPYDDHWVDAKGNLTFRGYADRQAAFRAFKGGSINTLINITTNTSNQIKNEMSGTAKVYNGDTFTSWELRSQHSFAPSMFREFKLAVSQVMNRQLINQIFSGGKAEEELYSTFIGQKHPWYPDNPDEVLTKIADSPTPNPETAKQVLKDAGWGWDDQGRLHYPPDKDLTPRWPKGSTPCEHPDKFPCLPELCPDTE